MSAIIYRLTNTVNGKTYIGLTTKTLDERWRQHVNAAGCGSSYYVHKAIRKYGDVAFTHEVLEETTTDLMNDRERHWIAECSPEYNMTAGGEGVLGWSPSSETRARMSVAHRGKTHSIESRKKRAAKLRGIPLSREHRAKLSEVKRGENNPFHGQTHSPETRAKMSAVQRGKPKSPETRAKISAAMRGRKKQATPRTGAAKEGGHRCTRVDTAHVRREKTHRVLPSHTSYLDTIANPYSDHRSAHCAPSRPPRI